MGTNRFSALYRFRALFGGDGKKRYIGTLLYSIVNRPALGKVLQLRTHYRGEGIRKMRTNAYRGRRASSICVVYIVRNFSYGPTKISFFTSRKAGQVILLVGGRG